MSTQLTCLDLLPYSHNITLWHSRKIISILKKLDIILEGIIQSQRAFFQDKNDALFNPHPDENCCEIRAVNLLLRATHFSKSNFEMNYQLAHFQLMKEKVQEKIIFLTKNKKLIRRQTLIDFLKEHELIFLINLIDQYLFVTFFLTKKNVLGGDVWVKKRLLKHYQAILPNLTQVIIIRISSDIADRKKFETALQSAKKQAESLNRAKTEFLENMRHDIRTPLTGIIGFARLIQKEARRPHIKEYVDNLVRATSALLDFQNEILDAIKVTTAKTSIAQQPFNLKNVVERVLNLVRPKAITKNLELQFYYDAHLPLFFIGDSKRLFRILLELITNALKFTAEGCIRIALHIARKNEQKIAVRFEVSDTGIGIPADKYDDIFIRFHRLSPSSDGIYEGTGLGLTVVKEYIKDLDGTIMIDSVTGKGSTFICVIPLLVVEDVIDTVPDHKNETEKVTLFDNKSILLIEDHAMTSTVTQLLLSELGCEVDIAQDAKTALEKSHLKKYDLIFLDLGLPDMSGFELAKKIRHDSIALNHHTIIAALTAHNEDDNKMRCYDSGIDAVFQKPLLKTKAIAILNTFLSNEYMNDSIINLALGAKRIGKDETAAHDMITLLHNNIDADKKNINDAFMKNDFNALREALHKLQGGLAYCGAPRMESAAKQLHDALKNNDMMNIPRLTRGLLTEIDVFSKHHKIVLPKSHSLSTTDEAHSKT